MRGPHPKVQWSAIAMLASLVGVAACTAPVDTPLAMNTETRNDLRFAVPTGRVVEAHDDRLVLKPAQVTRLVDEIVIWTSPPPPMPTGKNIQGNDPAAHTLVTVEGGNGGPEYTLSIPKRLGERAVTVRAYIQSEAGQPAFAEAWTVWRSVEPGQ